MSDVDILPAPVISDIPVIDDVWERNRAYFRLHRSELSVKYAGAFVAVHDGRVVAVGKTFVEAAKAGYAAVGYLPLYIDEVAAGPHSLPRIPSTFDLGINKE